MSSLENALGRCNSERIERHYVERALAFSCGWDATQKELKVTPRPAASPRPISSPDATQKELKVSASGATSISVGTRMQLRKN